MRPRKCSYASLVIQPEPVPVLGQSGDSMPTSSTPACSRATFTKPPMYDRGSQASSASPLAGESSWTKSSSVVSLGRNVTVSWTKFRTAMRISNPSGGDRTGTYYRGPRQGREAVRSNVDGPAVEKWRSRHGTHPDRSARHEGPAAALHPWLARGQHHLRGGPVSLRQS